MSVVRAGAVQESPTGVSTRRVRVTRTVDGPHQTVQLVKRQTSAIDSQQVGDITTYEVKRIRTASEPGPSQVTSYAASSQKVATVTTAKTEAWGQRPPTVSTSQGLIETRQRIASSGHTYAQSGLSTQEATVQVVHIGTQERQQRVPPTPQSFSYAKDVRIVSGHQSEPVTVQSYLSSGSEPAIQTSRSKSVKSHEFRSLNQPAQITSVDEKIGDKCFVVTSSTIPTKLENVQVSRGLDDSDQAYKTGSIAYAAQYSGEDKRQSLDSTTGLYHTYSGNNTSVPGSLYKEVEIIDSNRKVRDSRSSSGPSRKVSNSSYLSGTRESSRRQDSVNETVFNSVPSSDKTIRREDYEKRSVITVKPSDRSSISDEKPVTVQTLHLDDWKTRCSSVDEIDSNVTEPVAVHTLHLDIDSTETGTLASEGLTRAYQGTLVHSPPVQDTESIRLGNVLKLRQKFGKRKKEEYSLQNRPSESHSQTIERTVVEQSETTPYDLQKEVVICSKLEPEIQEEKRDFVYQVPVKVTSAGKVFKEVDVEKRRSSRSSRRSSSSSSTSSSYSQSSQSTMGNEQQRISNAEVTVEEDDGGNKMIVIEGKNIRLHSDRYATGKRGAQKVVVMNETSRSGDKTFVHDTEGSVNSYDSFDKRGRKEKMVVVNGHLGNEVTSAPVVKVARITSPTNVISERHIALQRKTEQDGVEYERMHKVKPVRMTTVNLIKRQQSDGQHDERVVDEGRLPNMHESILLFEKPQHHQKIKMGAKNTVGVTREGGQHSSEAIKRVVIQKQMSVPLSESRKEVEKRIIKVANSEDLAKSLQGNEVILDKSPPPGRRVKEVEVKVGKPSYFVQTSREDQVDTAKTEEFKQTHEVQTRSRRELNVHNDDNVFNTNYYIRRENPLYAEIEHGGPREHKLVIQKTSTEEPIYSKVKKTRKPKHLVKTEVHVMEKENAPIVHREEKQVIVSREVSSDQVMKEVNQETKSERQYGLSANQEIKSERQYGLSALLAKEREGVHEEEQTTVTTTIVNQNQSAPIMREEVQTTYTPAVSTYTEVHEDRIMPTVQRHEEVQNTTILRNLENIDRAPSHSYEDESKQTVYRTGTSSHANYSVVVDNTIASTNQANLLQSQAFESEKHATHWLIPDVSNRNEEYSESKVEYNSAQSGNGMAYRSDITIQPKEHQIFIQSIPVQANNILNHESDSKWLSKQVYYINVKDDTQLEVNLEPADNVLDVGYGGIYIEDVHPHVEMVYVRERGQHDRDSDTESVRSMYYTELDLDKRLSCLLPGWRCEEDEDVLKHIDVKDEGDDITAEIIQKETSEEMQVERGNILIKNSMITANGPKYVDVVDGEEEEDVETKPEVDDNSNVFDHHFHVNRENPLYSSDTETTDEPRNVRERFAPHNIYGRSKGGRSEQGGYSSSSYSRQTRSRKVNNEPSDLNGLIFSIPKAVFRSHFDRPRNGSDREGTTGFSNHDTRWRCFGCPRSTHSICDLLLNNVQLPDHFFYEYEGNKNRKKLLGGDGGRDYDGVDGEEEIQATVTTNVSSERQSLEEMAMARQRRVRPVSDSVKQHVHVDHEEEEVRGEPHLCHADGTNAESLNLLTFDTVSEDVHLGVKDGVAQVEVKVRCERVTPIEATFNMWRKSAVIITRLIQIDLEVTDERRELYKKIMRNEVGGRGMIGNGVATAPNGDMVLDKKQTFNVYSALMGIADEEERAALTERRPSKLLSLGSGVPEESVHDIHQFVKKSREAKSPRSRHKKKKVITTPPAHMNSDDLLY